MAAVEGRKGSLSEGEGAEEPVTQRENSRGGNLVRRIITALALLPIVIGAVWAGDVWFRLLLAVAGVIAGLEWAMMFFRRHRARLTFLAVFAIAGLGLLLAPAGMMLGRACLWFVVPGLLVGLAGRVLRRPSLAWSGFAFAWTWLALVSFAWLRSRPEDGLFWTLWVLLLVWATDIGGYFAGRGIGGPRLAVRISPNKTWAGLFGGMVLAALAAVLVGSIADAQAFGPVFHALAGAGLAVVAQAGDLLESAVKRHFGVKDSSHLIPGHGGLLDRIDGLLAAGPVVAIVLAWAG